MLQFHSLFSFITLILTLSFVGSAAADDDPRPHETETTTKTVALETLTQTKTTTTTSILDRTTTRDVTVDHTTTQTIFVTGSGSSGISTSLSKCNASTLYVTLSASTSSTSPTHVSTTTSVSTFTPSSVCKSASTVTTTLTKSNSTICPTLPASTITSIITQIQSGTTTCPTIPPSTLTITSVSTSVTTVTTTTTATPSPTCPQLVLNPSFESDSLTPWINDFDNPGVTVTVVASSTIPGGAHSGSFAASFTTNPNGPFLPGTPSDFYQSISIPPLCSSTQQYAFQAFVKTVGNTCYVNAYDNDSGAPFIDIMLTPGGAEPQWVEMTAVVTVGTGSFDLVLETACDTMDAVWIDDITLTPI